MIIFAGKLNDMKKVTELKDGMKVWMPFQVIKSLGRKDYPFVLEAKDALQLTVTNDCINWTSDTPLEIYEQEEIPLLTPVEMEVSDDGVEWLKRKIIGKIGNLYKDILGGGWIYARPIQKTVTLEIPESELTEELRKYLKR